MNSEIFLITSIFSSLFASATLWWWLKDALRNLLSQLCHQGGDTEFWARYTLLMLIIAPLSIVVWFVPSWTLQATEAVRHLMLSILLSHFFAFALVGRTLFQAVQQMVKKQSSLVAKQEG